MWKKKHSPKEQATRCPECGKMTFCWSETNQCRICYDCKYTNQYSREAEQEAQNG